MSRPLDGDVLRNVNMTPRMLREGELAHRLKWRGYYQDKLQDAEARNASSSEVRSYRQSLASWDQSIDLLLSALGLHEPVATEAA